MEDSNLQFVDMAGNETQGSVLYVQDGLMEGPSGEQYVTIIQDGQTYAIPAADYAAMIAQQDVQIPINSDKNDTNHSNEIQRSEDKDRQVDSVKEPLEGLKT